VALLVAWGAVVLALGVDCCDSLARVLILWTLWLRRGILTVGAGGGAAVGVVAELVDVDAALGIGVAAGDVP